MHLSLNFPLARLGFVDTCMEKVKLPCIIPLILERHQSLLFRNENLYILNLQSANLSGIFNFTWEDLSCLKHYPIILFLLVSVCMHGLNCTETEEATFMKRIFFSLKIKALEKNPFGKNFEKFSLLADLKL